MQIAENKILELKIPVQVKKDVVLFCKELVNVFPDTLMCGYIYGAAVKDEFIESVSAVNILVVLNNLDMEKIEKIAEKAKAYHSNSSIVPRFLMEKNVVTGLDVFALDYYIIKQEGLLIFGKDLFASHAIEEKHIVFQLERDTKAMRMKILQSFWRNSDQLPAMRKILFTNLRQLLVNLRVMLDIKKVSYNTQEDVVTQAGKMVGFSTDILVNLLNARKEKKQLTKNEMSLYIRDIFNVIAKMDDYFDEWNK